MNPKEYSCAKSLSTTTIDIADASVAVRYSESQHFRPSGNAWRIFKYPPRNRLSRHIEYYWLITEGIRKTSRISIYPNGGVGLVFNFGGPLLLDEITVGKGLFFDGASARTIHLCPVGNANMLGIRFRPGGFNRFFAIDLGKLHNIFGKLDSVDHQFPDRCLEAIALFSTDEEKIAAIETWLMCNYSEPDDTILQMESIVNAITTDRYFDLPSCLHDMHVDIRRFQRLFKKEVGMSPRKLTRILRADSARRLLISNSGLSFLDIAYKCGYYDQAHFNRDFKRVFGNTPSTYRKNASCSEEGPTIQD